MRQYPNLKDEYDIKEVAILKAKDWQLDLLKLNPGYVHWGCFEDAMSDKDRHWSSRIILPNWQDYANEWTLDDYNEIVNFYFTVTRKNHQCEHCEGENYNSATKQIADDWYDFNNTGRKWCYNITEVEIEALVKRGRLNDFTDGRYYFSNEKQSWEKFNVEKREMEDSQPPIMPTPEQVNTWASGRGIGHDAINRYIAIEARAKHLGVYGHCEHCVEGFVYDADEAHVSLQLWILHPRKGASRGVFIENIEEHEVLQVFSVLKEADERNKERFSKIP